MRLCFAVILAALSWPASYAHAGWDIVKNGSISEDNYNFSAVVFGKNGSSLSLECIKFNDTYHLFGVIEPSSPPPSDGGKGEVRVKIDGKEKTYYLDIQSKYFIGIDINNNDFTRAFSDMHFVSVTFTGENGKKVVDVFKPNPTEDNRIRLMEGAISCYQ